MLPIDNTNAQPCAFPSRLQLWHHTVVGGPTTSRTFFARSLCAKARRLSRAHPPSDAAVVVCGHCSNRPSCCCTHGMSTATQRTPTTRSVCSASPPAHRRFVPSSTDCKDFPKEGQARALWRPSRRAGTRPVRRTPSLSPPWLQGRTMSPCAPHPDQVRSLTEDPHGAVSMLRGAPKFA